MRDYLIELFPSLEIINGEKVKRTLPKREISPIKALEEREVFKPVSSNVKYELNLKPNL